MKQCFAVLLLNNTWQDGSRQRNCTTWYDTCTYLVRIGLLGGGLNPSERYYVKLDSVPKSSSSRGLRKKTKSLKPLPTYSLYMTTFFWTGTTDTQCPCTSVGFLGGFENQVTERSCVSFSTFSRNSKASMLPENKVKSPLQLVIS